MDWWNGDSELSGYAKRKGAIEEGFHDKLGAEDSAVRNQATGGATHHALPLSEKKKQQQKQ